MNVLKVALAQISPVWLNKAKTIEKIKVSIEQAGKQNCELVVWVKVCCQAILSGFH